ncbi:hypothetical protein G7K_5812-t1 [Saitoella complicata NRRL Y-17804]|uniref:Uncharacterized protein n=1 Tax=Saitoella complicata (strain BCRC 22490 / CBS 7301 / JCM 7358 / NBRC 10748 / NRRL Y-17804) TaxID=698492 RepID=A0A0E9NPF9_SAICN|nr:hypothetical protein G7K_5812-t1 [Saitoella complicata NRRL Y-17804]
MMFRSALLSTSEEGQRWNEVESYLLSTLNGVLSGNGDTEDVLVGVDKGVHDGDNGGVVGSQGDGGNGLDGGQEVGDEDILGNVENVGGEDVTVVVDKLDTHTVGEGGDVEHVQQGSLGSTDLGTGSNDLDLGNDFDGTTGNLGRNTQSLEERGLSGLHTGVTSGDEDIGGGDGTSTGRGSDSDGGDGVTDGLQVTVGENETGVTLDEGQQALVLGELTEEATDGTANHGVLTHEDDGITTELLTDGVHLLGRHIVDTNDEDGLVLLQENTELLEVLSLLCARSTHFDY